MADDITLTVRARNLTRGEFDRLGRQLRGMNREMRRTGGEADMSSAAVQRFGDNIRGVSRRMNDLRRTGSMGRHEMTHMRRTMGLLGRELAHAARTGELTREQFRRLGNELERTRLDFDGLARDVERQDAIQQRTARRRQQRQREEEQARRLAQRQVQQAQRQAQRDARAALSEATRRARGEQRAERDALNIRMAALRRRRQQEAADARAAAQAALREERRNRQLLQGAGDTGLVMRFRGMSDADRARMTSGLSSMSSMMSGLTGSSDRSRRSIGLLSRDLGTMSRVLRQANEDGHVTRRELDLLGNGLTLAARGARDLRRSGDLSRVQFRSMRHEIGLLRAQLAVLGQDGSHLDRLNARLRLTQARFRAAGDSSRGLRRSMNRLGDFGAGGLLAALFAVGGMVKALTLMKGLLTANKRLTLILAAALVLLGPIAQALGAVLVAALGGAFIALGAFALKGNAQVKSAFTDMKDTVVATMREAAAPMADDLVNGIDQVGAAFRAMGPQLSGAFAAAGPLIKDFFGAFTDFVGSALPGFTTAMQHSEKAMGGFRDAMSMLGQGFGEMMSIITVGNEQALADAWRVLGNELRNLLVQLGNFMSVALNSGTATTLLIGVFRTLTGVLNLVEIGLKGIDAIFGDLLGNILKGATGFDELASGTGNVSDALAEMSKPLPVLQKDLAAATKAYDDLKKVADDAGLSGPARDRFESDDGKSLGELKERQKALAMAVASAEAAAGAAFSAEAKSIHEVIDAMTKLNQEQISRIDAQAAVESAIDNAGEQAGKLKNALKVVNGEITNMTEGPAREAWGLLSQIAGAVNRNTTEAEKAKVPIQQMNEEFANGKQAFIDAAEGMNISSTEAALLAERVLRIPGKVLITTEMIQEQARIDLEAFNAAVAASPGKKSVTLETLSDTAVAVLRSFGYKVEHLPDGTVRIIAQDGQALGAINNVEARLNGLDGKTALTYVRTVPLGGAPPGLPNNPFPWGRASGGPVKFAQGGLIPGFPSGGRIYGPGTGTSDSILAAVSNGEFVMRAAAVHKYGEKFMEAVNRGVFPKFKRGGKVSKSEREARNQARGDFTISHFGRMAGYKNPEARMEMARPDSLAALVGSLNGLRGLILKATHGRQERSLLKRLDSAGRSLIKHEKNLLKVNKALEKAKDKLSDLKNAAKQLSESVRDGILSSSRITGMTPSDKNASVGGIMTGMRQARDKSTAFAQALKDLKAKGLSGDLIAQIAEGGTDEGLKTATALLGASSSEISTLNALQADIKKAASSAGKTAADAMYGAGIKAAQGLVDGLTKQKKKIEKAMMDIAKSMEKAIKKALGIRSPSRVMQEVGDQTAEGFAVGVQRNRSKDQAWASMLNVPQSSRGSGGGRVVLEISSAGSQIDEFLLQILRKSIRVRGGDVQVVLGK